MLTEIDMLAKEYYANEYAIESIVEGYEDEVALEADEGDTQSEIKQVTTDDGGKSENKASILQKIKNLGATLINMIKKMMDKIKNVVKDILVSDEGWKSSVEQAKRVRKPKSVKAVTYVYNNSFFDQVFKSATGVYNNLINEIQTKSNQALETSDENPSLEINILAKFVEGMKLPSPDKITSLSTMYVTIRNIYRGGRPDGNNKDNDSGKKSIIVASADVEKYVGYSLSRKKNIDAIKSEMAKILTKSKSTVALFTSKVSSAQLDKGKSKNLIKMFANYSKASNMYIQILKLKMQLWTEMTINSRIIVKKAYDIK